MVKGGVGVPMDEGVAGPLTWECTTWGTPEDTYGDGVGVVDVGKHGRSPLPAW